MYVGLQYVCIYYTYVSKHALLTKHFLITKALTFNQESLNQISSHQAAHCRPLSLSLFLSLSLSLLLTQRLISILCSSYSLLSFCTPNSSFSMCLILACSPFPFFSPIILLFPIPIILPPPSIFNHRLPILPPPYPPIPIPIFLLLILLARLTVVCAIYIYMALNIYLSCPARCLPLAFYIRSLLYPPSLFLLSKIYHQPTRMPRDKATISHHAHRHTYRHTQTHMQTYKDTRRHTCRHTKTHGDTHADTQRHGITIYMYATSHSFFCPFHPFLHFDRSSVGGLVRNSHGMEIITTHCNYG